jgi:hypothetical protein
MSKLSVTEHSPSHLLVSANIKKGRDSKTGGRRIANFYPLFLSASGPTQAEFFAYLLET